MENIGDIATMLHLPAGQQLFTNEPVTTQRILTFEGRPWKSDPDAQVLLLGDSFANIYSVDRLGWGAGAGLAEQLSYHLQQPVDKIALDAGGAHASRQALARELASGKDRLAGKKIVVYQFAMRELAFGDWKLIPLPDTRDMRAWGLEGLRVPHPPRPARRRPAAVPAGAGWRNARVTRAAADRLGVFGPA